MSLILKFVSINSTHFIYLKGQSEDKGESLSA